MTKSTRRDEPEHRPARPSWCRPFAAFTAVITIALLLAACGGSAATTAEPTTPMRLLEPAAFEQFLDENPGVDLINVHVPYQGHIDGTDSFVDYRQIIEHEGLPADRGDPVVLYCRSGSMSGQAAAELVAAGFTNVVDLDGGMNAWTESGRDLLLEEPVGG